MFTGIIEETGIVKAIRRRGAAWRLEIKAGRVCSGSAVGDSIAVDGVCLTVVELTDAWFAAEASRETLGRTTLADFEPGRAVNLERALTLMARLGGHLVQGHADARGRIVALNSHDDDCELAVRFPEEGAPYIARKGAVAVDGVSLTVAGLTGNVFSVAVVPYTLEHTTLARKRAGDEVNLEYDVIAKYVERLLTGRAPDGTVLGSEYLRERGF